MKEMMRRGDPFLRTGSHPAETRKNQQQQQQRPMHGLTAVRHDGTTTRRHDNGFVVTIESS